MACGIICTIASEIWFPGNRKYLFLAWLVIASFGTVCFATGVALAYDSLNILIPVFIAVHILIVVLIINRTKKCILRNQIPKSVENISQKREKLYELGAWSGTVLALTMVIQVIESVDNDTKSIVLSIFSFSVSIIIWARAQKLFQLYFSVKYNIEVVNTRDARKDRYKYDEEFPCPLLGIDIEEHLCYSIIYENEKMLKQDTLKTINKDINLTADELKQFCRDCKCQRQ